MAERKKRAVSRQASWKDPGDALFKKYFDNNRYQSRSARAIAFIENECRVPTGRNAGKKYKLLEFQKDLLRVALDEGNYTVIWSLPRGAGKTGLAAALLVYFLFEHLGAQVLACSTSMRTARLSYDRAVRIIETSPSLAEHVVIHRNAANPYIEMPARGAEMFPLPAEEKHIVGFSPSVVLIDEVGYVDSATYEAMQTSLGKVDHSLLLGIGTPGLGIVESDGLINTMWRIREMMRSDEPPPTMAYVEYSAEEDDDPSEPSTWRKANPGLGTLVSEKAVAMDYATMPASRFAQMRLGMWTQMESAWLKMEDWDALAVEPGPIPRGTAVALGFDGSASGDATALVAEELHSGRLVVLGFWNKPDASKYWKVPRGEVVAAIDKAFSTYDVVALFADPWFWRSELEELERQYGDRVVSWNTGHPSRMGPAADRFREAVRSGELVWDGNQNLRTHVLSAVAKRTSQGDVLVKDARRPQHIDIAIAAVLAHEAASTFEPLPKPAIF